MPFCSKCGTENPEEAQFCQNCGNATQGGGANANVDVPSLWNPKAAVWWSGLFLPLGPILHYLNWKAMGKDKEAKHAMVFAVSFCIVVLIAIFALDNILTNVVYLIFWLIWGWNLIIGKTIEKLKEKGEPLATGKEQVEYVAEKYGVEYKRKSWLAPIAIVVVVYGIIIFAGFTDSSGGVSMFESIGKETFTDPRDGKKYKMVKIGTQTWMAENLDYSGKSGDIGVCYDKEAKNCKKYGALYNFEEANLVCPPSWHLPRIKEWLILNDFVGDEEIAGKKLKAKNGWADGCKYTETTNRGAVVERNVCGTDEFGFLALPGGYGNSNGSFAVGEYGFWWSSSMDNSGEPYGTRMQYDSEQLFYITNFKSFLYSVRCLKDYS